MTELPRAPLDAKAQTGIVTRLVPTRTCGLAALPATRQVEREAERRAPAAVEARAEVDPQQGGVARPLRDPDARALRPADVEVRGAGLHGEEGVVEPEPAGPALGRAVPRGDRHGHADAARPRACTVYVASVTSVRSVAAPRTSARRASPATGASDRQDEGGDQGDEHGRRGTARGSRAPLGGAQ